MKCIFVGDLEDDAGFVAEVLQEKGIELIEAGVYDQIEKTINPVIEAQAEIVVYDLQKSGGKAHGFNRGMKAKKLFAIIGQ